MVDYSFVVGEGGGSNQRKDPKVFFRKKPRVAIKPFAACIVKRNV